MEAAKWAPIYKVPNTDKLIHRGGYRFDGPCTIHVEPCAPGECGFTQSFDSYLSALAAQSGCWEEYCEWDRLNRASRSRG